MKGHKVNVGQTVPEQLRLDLELERAAVTALNAGIERCRALADNGKTRPRKGDACFSLTRLIS